MPLYFLSFNNSYNSIGFSVIPTHEPLINTFVLSYKSIQAKSALSIGVIFGIIYSYNGMELE